MKIRYRSLACFGGAAECSDLVLGTQKFFDLADCKGPANPTFTFPMQGECMRATNGTQKFSVDASGYNISQKTYEGDDACNGGIQRNYATQNGRCWPLYEDRPPRSFMWEVDLGAQPVATSSATWIRKASPLMLSSLLLVVLRLSPV